MIVNSAMIDRSKVKPDSLIGKTVKIISGNEDFARMFIGSTGKVTGKCGPYKGAVVVKVNDYFVSFYPCELEVMNG